MSCETYESLKLLFVFVSSPFALYIRGPIALSQGPSVESMFVMWMQLFKVHQTLLLTHNVLLKLEPLSPTPWLRSFGFTTTWSRLNDRGVPVSANLTVTKLPLGVIVTTSPDSPHLVEDGSVTKTVSPGCNDRIDNRAT
jgi:hypothetical protein